MWFLTITGCVWILGRIFLKSCRINKSRNGTIPFSGSLCLFWPPVCFQVCPLMLILEKTVVENMSRRLATSSPIYKITTNIFPHEEERWKIGWEKQDGEGRGGNVQIWLYFINRSEQQFVTEQPPKYVKLLLGPYFVWLFSKCNHSTDYRCDKLHSHLIQSLEPVLLLK